MVIMLEASDSLKVTVSKIRNEAIDVASFELRSVSGDYLPAFTAGSHIDIHLPGSVTRSYSLLNDQDERDRYVVAVRKDRGGRGGSVYMHEQIAPGEVLTISVPRNNFELIEDTGHVAFLAGGIGITPIWAMMQRLERLGRSWELHYFARTRGHAAFCDDIEAVAREGGKQVQLHFDDGDPRRMTGMSSIIETINTNAHLYCCGPSGMLSDFREATQKWSARQVHLEYFSAGTFEKPSGGFEVGLAKTGRTLRVEPGKSILDVLAEAGVDAPHSCREGVCGACETRVLEGRPDHRDLVLTADERASGRTMMICCSGCLGDRLVLDI